MKFLGFGGGSKTVTANETDDAAFKGFAFAKDQGDESATTVKPANE